MQGLFKFTSDEVIQILISMLVIALAFSWGILISDGILAFLIFLPVILVGVGSGFILHELGHKFTAQRYGAISHYQSWLNGLAFTLLGAIATSGRLVFAAPGAVYIYGRYITMKQNAVISAAGPMVNLLLTLMFIGISALLPYGGYFWLIAFFGARVNLFLGIFNMIPFPPLDGSKVFAYSPIYWFLLTGAFIGASFLFGIPIF